MSRKQLTILSPQGMLGYGYPISSLQYGLSFSPDVIAVDAGSTDGGPHRLGLGVGGVSKYATKKDLIPLVKASKERNIPLIIGSAGGSGANKRVDWLAEIVQEISEEENLSIQTACIYADIPLNWLKEKWKKGYVKPCGAAPKLTEKQIDETTALVAQMGVEPIIEALKKNPDVIIAGRAYDPVLFAAYPIMHHFDEGLSLHLGKILECGALAAHPGTAKDGMIGIIRKDHFLVFPTNKKRRCTVESVAAHTLYEKSHPYLLPGPGGLLDLSEAEFTQFDERTVKVTGSQFREDDRYTIKAEGVKPTGFRTVLVAGVRDPLFIEQYEQIVAQIIADAKAYFPEIDEERASIFIKTYGIDGVLGHLETNKQTPFEIGIIVEAIAETQELADSVVAYIRADFMHLDYSGRVSTSGNLALPFAPPELSAGETFEFSIYHLIELDEQEQLFPITYKRFGGET